MSDKWMQQIEQPPHPWEVGTAVYKPKGYPFPGEVRSAFRNATGDLRYVIESEVAPGMLHIFAPNQLLPAPKDASQ